MAGTMKTAIAAALLATGAAPAAAQVAVEAPGPEGSLAGTFVAPAEGKPVVLVIPGSGPTDRDGNNPMGVTAAPYKLLAEALAERGIGTLRADKRGLFASKAAVADANAVTISDYVDDVLAWSTLARAVTGRECVWLLGHSEGGLVALAAQERLDNICGLVLIAAPARSFGDLLREQLAANPANALILADALSAIDALEAGDKVDVSGMHPALQGLFAPQVQGFLIDAMRYDPAAMAAKSSLPILIVQGGKDIQVPQAHGELFRKSQPSARYALLPDMNHVLKDVPGDDRAANLGAYGDPSLPLAQGLVDAIAGFIAGGE
ncbi:alpha/beta hydrolase [Qipengyuania gaetbuli]|uniref:alpha/beta hydrolase n=1 Tax=Qipengyuania gaetbuli TaxID=266952 RepID=UPI0021BD3F9A|nr:lysophospholipase [Qipengyuania gaetbuli]